MFSRRVLSDEDLDFQVQTYAWLLKNFDSQHFYQETVLVLPEDNFFQVKKDTAEQFVESVFIKVKEYAGMEKWECKLEAQEEDINPYLGDAVLLQEVEGTPNGTFSYSPEEGIKITYAPRLANQPIQLVATFAHELAHYLTGGDESKPPPGGWDNWEFATDIAAVFLGFGVFTANSVFSFSQYGNHAVQGWQSSRSGYLSQQEMSYALAIFTELKGIDFKVVTKYLDSSAKNWYKKAIRDIRKYLIKDHILEKLDAKK